MRGGGRDKLLGPDNDNADNPFIQPVDLAAKQHMENTDVLVGRGKGDLLVGFAGGDTILGNGGRDVTVGGPEGGQAPNSDVLLGGRGDDINIWAPGDGSDAHIGGPGYDTQVFAPFVTNDDGSLKIVRRRGRDIPLVKIDEAPQFSCEIVEVPDTEDLGFDHLVRFLVNDTITVTVRQRNVEQVLCPGANPGEVEVANLTRANPSFHARSLHAVRGRLLRAIIQAH